MAATLGPFAGCRGCRHVCDHRAYAHSVAHGRHAQEGFGEVWTKGLAIREDRGLPAGTRWDTEPYDDWWPELRGFVASLGGPRPEADGAASDDRGDFDACVLLHLWWARWHNEPPERFMAYFRRHRVEA